MTLTTAKRKLLPGVDQHGSGYRCRLSWDGEPYIETGLPTAARANARILVLRELRENGDPRPHTAGAGDDDRTLADAAADLLKAKKVSGRKRKLRKRGIEHWKRSLKPWAEGEHAATPLRLLRRQPLHATILDRAIDAPTAARNELQALKAIIRAEANPQIDQTILAIEAIAVEPRIRRALSVLELEFFAACAPEYARRMLLILGTSGLRIGEAFTLTDDRVELHRATPAAGDEPAAPAYGTALVTAELAKERLEKNVALDAENVALTREQLVARAAGTRYVFPTATGKRWRYGQFHKLVWAKATRRAAAAWRDERGLDELAPTPFEWFEPVVDENGDPVYDEQGEQELERQAITPHDLRATAATLMRDAGLTREEAADQLGHVDTGELLDRVYDQGDRGARARKAIAQKAPQGLRATLQAEPGARQALTPAAAGSAAAGQGLNSPPDAAKGTT